ncbi:YpoC family protein [Staphylococcus sp. 11261D007BR]
MENNIERFKELEEILDVFANQRKIGQDVSFEYLDQYYDQLLTYLKNVNNLTSEDTLDINDLKLKPFNLEERLQYIKDKKHHYMGYQQMKTLKAELIKMNAAYQARYKS